MGRWSAVSDWDYYEELDRRIIARARRCQHCGEEMTVVYNGDGAPVWMRCEHCEKTK